MKMMTTLIAVFLAIDLLPSVMYRQRGISAIGNHRSKN